MSEVRHYTPADRLLMRMQQGLSVLSHRSRPPHVDYPAQTVEDPAPMDDAGRRHAAGLMRVNHTGEIAAQALYHGQAFVARKPELVNHLLEAADEEAAHLDWCRLRLEELGEGPSRLAPLWYAGSFAIGAAAGLAGDRFSLGFVAETERQVSEHLQDHLRDLPADDERSRAVVRQMREDEERHGQNALDHGGVPLPAPFRGLMRGVASVMKRTAYRI